MPDSMLASERDTWRSRLWRFLAAWGASLYTDPIEAWSGACRHWSVRCKVAPPRPANKNNPFTRLEASSIYAFPSKSRQRLSATASVRVIGGVMDRILHPIEPLAFRLTVAKTF